MKVSNFVSRKEAMEQGRKDVIATSQQLRNHQKEHITFAENLFACLECRGFVF